MEKIVNLTPHTINLCGEDGSVKMSINPSEKIARVSQDTQVVDQIISDGIGVIVTETVFGQVENLPEPKEGVIYLVSRLVKSRVPHRNDVLVPDTSSESAVRDSEGRIVGVKRLSR